MIDWTRLLSACPQAGDWVRFCARRNDAPKIVVWNVTSKCNFRCLHCYANASAKKSPSELSRNQAEHFLADLAGMGTQVVIFSGGEPLLREDVLEMGKFARDKGLRPVLSTNGSLITKDAAGKIVESGFAYCGVSLDGGQKTHDRFRRKKGAYCKTLAGLRNCQNAGLKVGVRFTLTLQTAADLPDVFEFVEREAIPRLCIYHLAYSGRATRLLKQDLTHRQRRNVMEFVWAKSLDFLRRRVDTEVLTVDNHADAAWIYLKVSSQTPRKAGEVLRLLEMQGGNSSGVDLAAVDSEGNVYADQFLTTRVLGNIRSRPFSEIWSDNQIGILQALRNRLPFLKGRCRRCRFVGICNGNLRARAEAVTGDLWGEDPSCYLTDEEVYDGKGI